MTKYLRIDRLEIITTYRCNSNCDHCLIQPGLHRGETMAPDIGAQYVANIAELFHPYSIMTFGGEPILALETTLAVHRMAKAKGVQNRQLLTNGNWVSHPTPNSAMAVNPITTTIKEEINHIANQLAEAGVNDVIISMDAFHLKHLNMEMAILSAKALMNAGIQNVKFSPRWIVSSEYHHPVNKLTQKILQEIEENGFHVMSGEAVRPRGNALLNYEPHFSPIKITGNERCEDTPYHPRLDDLHGVCISPTGEVIICDNVIIGCVSPDQVNDLLATYNPFNSKDLKSIIEKGLKGLEDLLTKQGIAKPQGPFYSICHACFEYRKALGMTRFCIA